MSEFIIYDGRTVHPVSNDDLDEARRHALELEGTLYTKTARPPTTSYVCAACGKSEQLPWSPSGWLTIVCWQAKGTGRKYAACQGDHALVVPDISAHARVALFVTGAAPERTPMPYTKFLALAGDRPLELQAQSIQDALMQLEEKRAGQDSLWMQVLERREKDYQCGLNHCSVTEKAHEPPAGWTTILWWTGRGKVERLFFCGAPPITSGDAETTGTYAGNLLELTGTAS
ncbi:MAG TPA: hypothetical protein VMV93_01455 [Chloroflexota bacterium]|nr:hypothetical protein [Chloroflexota bacterium]